jgi:hypothetical protein
MQYMFPEGVTVDEDGIPMSILPTVPSRYDMQKLDALIRSELSLADPREGGGELSMTSMIAEVVVDMVERFCSQAKGAVSDVGEKCIRPEDGTATEALVHDLKVAGVMVSFYPRRRLCCVLIISRLTFPYTLPMYTTELSCNVSQKCAREHFHCAVSSVH